MSPRNSLLLTLGVLVTECVFSRPLIADAASNPLVCDFAELALVPRAKSTPDSGGYARTGARNVLVIRLDFSDAPGATIDADGALAQLASVNTFLQANSFQQLSLAVTAVTPVLRLPRSAGSYRSEGEGYVALAADGRAAALAAGYDVNSFDFLIYAFPQALFGFTARAATGKGIWIHGNNFTAGVIAHEFGHNLGVGHANAWIGAEETVVGPGSFIEYGNLFDTMGTGIFYPASHYNANFKYLIGWLTDADMHLAATSGVYRVFASDKGDAIDFSKRYALRVPANALFQDVPCDYWIEVRQNLGYDRPDNGVLITAATSFYPFRNFLLDTTPGSLNERLDSPLIIGCTFADSARNVFITPLVKGEVNEHKFIDVAVKIGVTSNQAPTFSLNAASLVLAPGQGGLFTASASDPDGDALAYFWDFNDMMLATNLNSATVYKSWPLPGHYVVQCTVSDMKGGSATKSVVVQVGAPTTFTVTGRALFRSQPISGARVLADIGARYTFTDSDGSYTLIGIEAGSHLISAIKADLSFGAVPVSVGPNAADVDLIALPVSAPLVLGFSPTNGAVGTQVTIAGLNFARVSSVRFGEIAVPFYNSSSTQIVAVVPSGAVSAPITVATAAGVSSSTDSFNVVPTPVSIVIPPQNRFVPLGSNCVLTVEVDGSGPFNFQWQKNGIPIPSATNATLLLTNLQLSDDGSYSVIVSNTLNSVTSRSAQVTALTIGRAAGAGDLAWTTSSDAPWFAETNVWLDSPYAVQSAPSSQASWIETTITGPGRLKFSWQLQAKLASESLSFTIDGTLTDRISGPTSWREFSVIVPNGAHVLRWTRSAAAPTTSAWLSGVKLEQAWFVTQPQNLATILGTDATLSALGAGIEPVSYQWLFNGGPIPNATSTNLILSKVTPKDEGSYEVVIRNSLVAVTSVVASVTLVPISIVTAPQPSFPFAGSTAMFSVEVASSQTPSYQWFFKGLPLGGETNATLTIANALPANNGSYQVIITNSFGAVTSAPVVLTVSTQAPSVSIGIKQPPGFTLSTTNYAAYVGEDVILGGSNIGIPRPTRQWYLGTNPIVGATNSELALQAIQLAQAGNYFTTGSNILGRAVSLTLHLTVAPIAVRENPRSFVPLVGQNFSLSVTATSAAPISYQWRFKGTPIVGAVSNALTVVNAETNRSGAYDVVMSNAMGTVTSAMANVSLRISAPQFLTNPVSTAANFGQPFWFFAFAVAGPPATYQWFFKNVPIAGATNNYLFFPSAAAGSEGSYFVMASNSAGTRASDVAQMTLIRQKPALTLGTTNLSVVGAGTFVPLRVYDGGAQPATYQWHFNGSAIPGATNTSLALPSVTGQHAGEYRLSATNAFGFAISDPLTVKAVLARGLDVWHRRAPVLTSEDLAGVAYGNGTYVAVGKKGAVLTSPDSVVWTERSLPADLPFTSIAFANGVFVASMEQSYLVFPPSNPFGIPVIGSPVRQFGNLLLVSSNGINWFATTLPGVRTGASGVTTASNRFFVMRRGTLSAYASYSVASDLVLLTSRDGLTWEPVAGSQRSGTFNFPDVLPNPLLSMPAAYGDGQYVAAGYDISFASSDGTNWIPGAGLAEVRSACFGNGLFVAVGRGGRIWSSAGGASWVQQNSTTTNDLFATGFVSNRFVAIGANGTLLTSANSTEWNPGVSNTSQDLQTLSVGTNHIVAVGNGGVILKSSDGVNWMKPQPANAASLNDLIFLNGSFIAVGDSGTVLSSVNGTEWPRRTAVTDRHLRGVTFGAGTYVAVGEAGTIITSTDGTSWNTIVPQTSNTLEAVAWADGTFAAVGTNGTILTSSDGFNWIPRSVSGPANTVLEGVAYGNGLIVAVGGTGGAIPGSFVFENSVIVTSPDSVVWTRQPTDFAKQLHGITFANGRFVAVGSGGLIASSLDGYSWRFETIADGAANLRNITYAAGLFVAVGDDGTVFSSPDAFDWKQHRPLTSKQLRGIVFGNNSFVAVGSDGVILQSERVLPALFAPVASEPNTFRFGIETGLHDYYRLQASTNSITWSDLLLLTNSSATMWLTNSASEPERFFRLKYP